MAASRQAVPVPESVLEGLRALQEADEVNEFHHTEARRYAFENDYFDTSHWIKENPKRYARGLQMGFEADG